MSITLEADLRGSASYKILIAFAMISGVGTYIFAYHSLPTGRGLSLFEDEIAQGELARFCITIGPLGPLDPACENQEYGINGGVRQVLKSCLLYLLQPYRKERAISPSQITKPLSSYNVVWVSIARNIVTITHGDFELLSWPVFACNP